MIGLSQYSEQAGDGNQNVKEQVNLDILKNNFSRNFFVFQKIEMIDDG
jgi:hypothetical protein